MRLRSVCTLSRSSTATEKNGTKIRVKGDSDASKQDGGVRAQLSRKELCDVCSVCEMWMPLLNVRIDFSSFISFYLPHQHPLLCSVSAFQLLFTIISYSNSCTQIWNGQACASDDEDDVCECVWNILYDFWIQARARRCCWTFASEFPVPGAALQFKRSIAVAKWKCNNTEEERAIDWNCITTRCFLWCVILVRCIVATSSISTPWHCVWIEWNAVIWAQTRNPCDVWAVMVTEENWTHHTLGAKSILNRFSDNTLHTSQKHFQLF